MSLTFVGLNPATEAVNGVINLTALGANAEITAFNSKTGYGYTVGGGSGAIIVLDLRDPSKAKAVAKAAPTVTGQTLQSAAVFGNLLAVAVQNTVKTEPGFVQFYNLSDPALPVHVSTVTVGALPDMVKFNALYVLKILKLLISYDASKNKQLQLQLQLQLEQELELEL